jgi:hypothetical protein
VSILWNSSSAKKFIGHTFILLYVIVKKQSNSMYKFTFDTSLFYP